MINNVFEKKGIVSVFLGTVSSKEVLDQYLHEDYAGIRVKSRWWDELGITWFDHDFQDALFNEAGAQAIEVFLQHPFSYINTFRAPVIEACRALGLSKANAGIFMYDFDYSTAGRSPQFLEFVGSFPYTVEHPGWMNELMRKGLTP